MKRAGLLGEAALVIVLGPFAWEFASRHMEAKTFITAEIGAAVAAGGCASSLRPSGILALLRCLRCLFDRGGKPASALDAYPSDCALEWEPDGTHPLHLPRKHLSLRQFLLVEGLIHSVQKPLYTTFTPRGASLTDEVRDQTWCNRHSADVKTLLMQIPVML